MQRLLEFFNFSTDATSNAVVISSSSSAPANTVPASIPTSQSNEDRLAAIHYKNNYPRYFECPISLAIMSNPVNLQGSPNACYDYATAIQLTEHPTKKQVFDIPFYELLNTALQRHKEVLSVANPANIRNPKEISDQIVFNALITKKQPFFIRNNDLKEQIDQFVNDLELLSLLFAKLDIMLCPIDNHLDQLVPELNRADFIAEQKEERVKQIACLKRSMWEILTNFITHTESCIEKDAEKTSRKKDEEEQEIKAILAGPKQLHTLLLYEFELLDALKTKQEQQYLFAIEHPFNYQNLIFNEKANNPEFKMAKTRNKALQKHIDTIEKDNKALQKHTDTIKNKNSLYPICCFFGGQIYLKRKENISPSTNNLFAEKNTTVRISPSPSPEDVD